jgi:hypothetical protein
MCDQSGRTAHLGANDIRSRIRHITRPQSHALQEAILAGIEPKPHERNAGGHRTLFDARPVIGPVEDGIGDRTVVVLRNVRGPAGEPGIDFSRASVR